MSVIVWLLENLLFSFYCWILRVRHEIGVTQHQTPVPVNICLSSLGMQVLNLEQEGVTAPREPEQHSNVTVRSELCWRDEPALSHPWEGAAAQFQCGFSSAGTEEFALGRSDVTEE